MTARDRGDRQDFISGDRRYMDSRSNEIGAEWDGMWFIWY